LFETVVLPEPVPPATPMMIGLGIKYQPPDESLGEGQSPPSTLLLDYKTKPGCVNSQLQPLPNLRFLNGHRV
jgi:hypothetical protein